MMMRPELVNNLWFYAFVSAAPFFALVSAITRHVTAAFLLASLTGWPLLCFAVDRAWDIRVESLPSNATQDERLAATADGANIISSRLLGWIVSAGYATVVFGLAKIIAETFTLIRKKTAPADHP